MNKLVPYRATPPALSNQPLPLVPVVHSAGLVESVFVRLEARNASKNMRVLTRRAIDAANLLDAQTGLIKAKTSFVSAQVELAEVEEKSVHERDMRRVHRLESLTDALETHHTNNIDRATNRAVHETALIDAQQQRDAQKEHGHITYRIAHKQKQLQMLGLELEEHEKKKMFEPPEKTAKDDELERLYKTRDDMNARGLDTTAIDNLIATKAR